LSLYTNGMVDFSKIEKSKSFKEGIDVIISSLNTSNIVLMCTESNPIECHRSILLGKVLYKRNIEIKHILKDGSILTQEDIEKEILNEYFPNRDRIRLIQQNEDIDYLNEAYHLQNIKICCKN